MKIDPQNGTVAFPNGYSIGSECTHEVFRSSPVGVGARTWDCGTLPWIHYTFDGGEIDGSDLIVSLCFYDQLLVYVEMTVSLYPPDRRDWSYYSLDTEAAEKSLHERILKEQFGEPSIGASRLSNRFPAKQDTLNHRVDWQFKWGKVISCHDSKGGGTFVRVRYGDREERATAAYRSQQTDAGHNTRMLVPHMARGGHRRTKHTIFFAMMSLLPAAGAIFISDHALLRTGLAVISLVFLWASLGSALRWPGFRGIRTGE